MWTKRYTKSKDTALHGIFIDGKDVQADGSAVVTTDDPGEDQAANAFEGINVLGRYAEAGKTFEQPFDKEVHSVEMRFNGNMDPSSENLDKIKVLKGNDAVAGEMRSSFNSVTFVPEETMKEGSYTVQIPADVKNSAGQGMGAAATASFEVKPTVEVVYVRNGLNYMTRRVEVGFNDRIVASTAGAVIKYIYPDKTEKVLEHTGKGNHGGKLFEIKDTILPSGTYNISFKPGIKSISGAVSTEPWDQDFEFDSTQLSAKITVPKAVNQGENPVLKVKECIGYGELRYAFSEEELQEAAYQPVTQEVSVNADGLTEDQVLYVQFRVNAGGQEGMESPVLHKAMKFGILEEGKTLQFDMRSVEGAYDKDGFGSIANPTDGVFDLATNEWGSQTGNYIADGENGLEGRYDQDKDGVITTEEGITYQLSDQLYTDGQANVATGNGKEIPAPSESAYEKIYVLAAGKYDDNKGTFTLNYTDGTSDQQEINAHYWASNGNSENIVFSDLSVCYGWTNNGIYTGGVMRQYELKPDDSKILKSVTLPKTENLIRIFAMTGKEVDKIAEPGTEAQEPADVTSYSEGEAERPAEESDPDYDEFIKTYGDDEELRGAADVTDVTNIKEVEPGERSYDDAILAEQEETTGGYGQGLYPYARQPEKLMSYKIRMQAYDDYELDIEDALEAIRRVDNLSRGLEKKCYLVGWQTNGHDSAFPYFGEVNPRHKRPMDKDSLESLKWLMKEAKKYHTTVTLHVNFSDAYTDDNPLGQKMLENQIAIRTKDGTIRQTGRWAGHVGFFASAYANYFTGNWQKNQIDPLIAMLPELKGQSVHPDAWYSHGDAYYGLTAFDTADAQRRSAKYVREKYGMDLTTEFDFQFGGGDGADHVLYFPMIWQGGWCDNDPLKVPSYFQSTVNQTTHNGQKLMVTGRYFGEGSAVEPDLWSGDYGNIQMPGLKESFAQKELTRQYLNTLLRASLKDDPSAGGEAVLYAGDGQKVVSSWNGDDSTVYKRTVTVGDGVILQEPGNVFMPMTWRPGLEIQAWSQSGYTDKSWKLPVEWKDVAKVDLYDLSLEGLRYVKTIDVSDGKIRMSLAKDQTAVLVPARNNPNSTKGFEQNGSVQFLGKDTKTGSDWTGTYGKEGYDIYTEEQISDTVEISYVNAAEKEIEVVDGQEEPPAKTDLAKAVVKAIPVQYYDGRAKTPGLTITYGGRTLVKDRDYRVTYAGNKNIGTAKAVASGIGDYTGNITANFQITVRKNTSYTIGNYKYKITNAKTNGKGSAALTGVKSKAVKNKLKKVTVASTVKIGGRSFRVTEIGSKAFAGCRKLTSVSVGKNVSKIGSGAFSGSKKLTKITISSTKLKSVGKNAFKSISSKAKIKVPKSRKKAYKKLLKSKGQKKSVKIS